MAISYPARIASVPTHSEDGDDDANALAVSELEQVSHRVQVVRLGQSLHSRPIHHANTIEPSPADPTHHQALSPSR